MRLLLVRHGETEENVAKRSNGILPGKLSAKGKEQAEKLAVRLSKEKIDAIYASDLGRVQETLAPFHEKHPEIPITKSAQLQERNYGIYEGEPWGSIQKEAGKKGFLLLSSVPRKENR